MSTRMIFALSCLLLPAAGLVYGADPAPQQQSKSEFLQSSADSHPYTQMFTLEAGPFRPASLSVANSNAKFDYSGASLNSYLAEPGWNIKLFHLLGAVSLQESLALSMFKANLPGSSDSLSLFMMGVDTRLRHSWEWFPVRAIVPFIEGGYQYSFFSQSGPSDFQSAQSSVGNLVAGAGLDLWINAIFGSGSDAVNRYNVVPFFLTAKVNYIAPGTGAMNLGSTSFLAGLSIGI